MLSSLPLSHPPQLLSFLSFFTSLTFVFFSVPSHSNAPTVILTNTTSIPHRLILSSPPHFQSVLFPLFSLYLLTPPPPPPPPPPTQWYVLSCSVSLVETAGCLIDWLDWSRMCLLRCTTSFITAGTDREEEGWCEEQILYSCLNTSVKVTGSVYMCVYLYARVTLFCYMWRDQMKPTHGVGSDNFVSTKMVNPVPSFSSRVNT